MVKILQKEDVFFHSLNGISSNSQVLIILHFDYFINKSDLKILKNKYENIILIPIDESKSITKNAEFIFELIAKGNKITIVFNSYYKESFGDYFNFEFKNNKLISFIEVSQFCECMLKKCYVSDNINIHNLNINNLKYFTIYPRIVKKSIDWIFGVVIYVISQPLWLISAIKIYLESPGPIFYIQSRIGINDSNIKVFKFRSMRLDAEQNGAQFSNKNDDRIFPFGKIMRATRIDELPQLFNILKGELSLIGPRPERKVFIETFEELIPHYNERHAVKPGISGYAQIMYPYGAGLKDARHKLMYDLYYIKNWNLKLEAKIIFLTIYTIVTKKGI